MAKLDQWENNYFTQKMKLTSNTHYGHLNSNYLQERKHDIEFLLFTYKRLCTGNFGIWVESYLNKLGVAFLPHIAPIIGKL